jgi:hypothetical protein
MPLSDSLQAVALAAPLAIASAAGMAADLTSVPAAQPKIPGVSQPVVLSPELIQYELARGSFKLENPDGVLTHYGYNSDVLNAAHTGPQMVPAPGDIQSTTHNVEASKTEPDKNTYLVFPALSGPDANYDYGHRFLFQGHETGRAGYITRINLDADYAHRVTLLASHDKDGNAVPVIDGSTWYPWARRLLFTAELGSSGGVWQATPDYPSTVEDISGIMGRGGYEGIQADSDGNIWIVEDVGGTTVNSAKQPNSFVYRFIPYSKYDLTKGGKLQVLQVESLANPGQPIVFHAGQAQADILSQDSKDLHTYGKVFKTKWVQIHDTAADGTTPFNANQLAKTAGGTPFKRPENGQFRPGARFTEFFFDETGDTDADTAAGREFGGFGSILKLRQSHPSANEGTLTLFYLGDKEHSGLDNVAFWSDHEIVFVEDAGDKLHDQRNALDSAYLFDVRKDYSTGLQPVRIIAQGRDPSATIDSAYSAAGGGFQNEGDNELTGIHVSDGDPTPGGILGAKTPQPFWGGWRVFYTQQHGDNVTYEILPNPAKQRAVRGHDHRD